MAVYRNGPTKSKGLCILFIVQKRIYLMKCVPCTYKRCKSKEIFSFFHALHLNFYLEPRQPSSQEKETEACSSNTISSSSSIPNPGSLTGSQQQPQAINLVDSSAVNEPLTREIPAQDQVKGDIKTLESKIASLSALKESGFTTAENTKHLKDSQDQLEQVKQRLRAYQMLKSNVNDEL